jgi:hypothetical protein
LEILPKAWMVERISCVERKVHIAKKCLKVVEVRIELEFCSLQNNFTMVFIQSM